MFKYVPLTTKTGKDNFQYCEVEVKGHSLNCDAREHIQVCSAISAVCNGIYRLLNDLDFDYKYGNGYFHIVRKRSCYLKDYNYNFRVDSDSNYALNTILCQLYEIYLQYPKHFTKFDLIELKEYVV